MEKIPFRDEIISFAELYDIHLLRPYDVDPYYGSLCVLFTLSNILFNEVDSARRFETIEEYFETNDVSFDEFYESVRSQYSVLIRKKLPEEYIFPIHERELILLFYCLRKKFILFQYANTKEHIAKNRKSWTFAISISFIFGVIFAIALFFAAQKFL